MRTRPKVVAVAGTRPDAIKLAPVVRRLQEDPELDVRLLVTGQHREILQQVLTTFGLVPQADLAIMQHGQGLGPLFARAVEGLWAELQRLRPQVVCVQGDTSTTFAAALAAFYSRIPVAHVEAGLRTGDLQLPFPEEANRKLVAAVTALHLAPTPRARANLLAEGVPPPRIVVTGNTVVDALRLILARPVRFTTPGVAACLQRSRGRQLVVVTSHRRENWGEPQRAIARAVRRAAQRFPQASFLVPLHPNPVVRGAFVGVLEGLPNVAVTPPLPYREMVAVLSRAWGVVTDSGGIQEEGCALGVPVLVCREVTERPEGVEAGVVSLVGTSEQRVFRGIARLLADPLARRRMARASGAFGDGRAAERVHAALRRVLGMPAEEVEPFVPPRDEAPAFGRLRDEAFAVTPPRDEASASDPPDTSGSDGFDERSVRYA